MESTIRFWMKVFVVLFILIFVGALIVLAGMEIFKPYNDQAAQEASDHVIQSLKLGMSKPEVSNKLELAGVKNIAVSQGDVCTGQIKIKSERWQASIYGTGLYWYRVDFLFCFDDAGALIYFGEIFS